MINTMSQAATLSDKLALMPDNMLPRLAQQYKGDAITLSLIWDEKKRRDRVRNTMKAEAGAQPQPKVNDQIVASMQMPEDVGIGALSAPNMQRMADGGIAGYSDGDLIAQNEPVLRMAEGGVARYADQGLVRGSVMGGTQYDIPGFQQGSTPLYNVQQQGAPENTPLFQRWYNSMQETGAQYQLEQAKSRIAAGVGTAADRAIVAEAAKRAPTTDQDLAQFDAAANLYMTEREAAKAAKAGAAPKADTTGKEDKPTKTDYSVLNTGAPRGAGAPSSASLQKQYADILKAQDGTDPAAKERAELQRQMVSSAEQAKSDIEADQAKRGDVYKGREERLSKREQELTKADAMDNALALIGAGLRMAGTRGHWTEGAREAGQEYVARRSEGLAKLRAAQERLGEARDRMEDLKINRDDMNAKEIRQANNEINRAKMDAQKLGIDAIMARDNVNRDTAGKIFAAQVQTTIAANETASRERIAGMPGANERIALLLGGGDLAKGMERLAAIQAGKFNPMTAYTEYLSKRKEGDTTLTPAEFVNQIRSVSALMAGAPAASNKPTGKVYE